jgi:hypothetical protein
MYHAKSAKKMNPDVMHHTSLIGSVLMEKNEFRKIKNKSSFPDIKSGIFLIELKAAIKKGTTGEAKARSGARGNKKRFWRDEKMTMLARKEDGQVLTIEGYEARIALYREQIGTGYIGIGRTLNEAKEAGVVPHGQWEEWVTRTTGLTVRQAQRCMQAATEIRDGSAMARLEMSKALMLLSSGLDEEQREEIAEKAAGEGATVKALREEIRQTKLKLVQETGAAAEIREALKKAEEERQQIQSQMRAAYQAFDAERDRISSEAYQRGIDDGANESRRDAAAKEAELTEARRGRELAMKEAREARQAAEKEAREEIRKEFEGKLDFNLGQIETLRAQLRAAKDDLKTAANEQSKAWDKGFNAGKDEAEKLRAEIEQIEQELEKQIRGNVELHEELKAAEAREAKRSAQLEELKRERQSREMNDARGIRASGPDAMDLTAAVREFIGRAGVLPQMGAQLAGMAAEEIEAIRLQVATVARWVEGSLDALATVQGVGSVV